MTPTTRVNITPPGFVWTDVNVSAYVNPGNTAGVMLEIINTSGTFTRHWGARKNGSTDALFGKLFKSSHTWATVGVDSNDILELRRSDVYIQIYLVAYVQKDEGAFFTNSIDKSLVALSVWTDIDISGDTGSDTAILAFFLVYATEVVLAAQRNFGLREKGSTDMLWDGIDEEKLQGAFAAVDDNEICQGFIQHPTRDFYLTGYLTANFYSPSPNRKDYSTVITDTWVDVDMSDVIPVGEIGAFMYFRKGTQRAGIRKKGTDIDNYYHVDESAYPWVELGSNRVVEQKIASPTLELYLLGYGPLPNPTAPTSLLCNGKTNPIELETLTPYFSAIYNDPNAEDIAQHYQIQLNTASDFTRTMLWDSGKTSMSNVSEGERCEDIGYNGSALSRDTTYYWRIKFWDDEGNEGVWSTEMAYFSIAEAPIIPPERENPVDAVGKVKKARLPLLTRRRELIRVRLLTPPTRIILDP